MFIVPICDAYCHFLDIKKNILSDEKTIITESENK